MESSEGLGSLSILSDDLLRLILLDASLKRTSRFIASSSTQLLRHLLQSGVELMLDLGRLKLSAKWGEWLQQASGLHLRLNAADEVVTAEAAAVIMALLLPAPNLGISALTVDLDVSDAHGTEGRSLAWDNRICTDIRPFTVC